MQANQRIYTAFGQNANILARLIADSVNKIND